MLSWILGSDPCLTLSNLLSARSLLSHAKGASKMLRATGHARMVMSNRFTHTVLVTGKGPSIKDVRTQGGRGGGSVALAKCGRPQNSNFYQNFRSLSRVL